MVQPQEALILTDDVTQPVVAAGDATTAAVGAQILAAGGNAVDAAIGATCVAFVSEPVLTAPFGGGFATVAGDGQPPKVFDFFADIPGRGLRPALQEPDLDFIAVDVDFGAATQTFHIGRGAVAASLMLPGLHALHHHRGRLPFDQVVAPAVRCAHQGVTLTSGVTEFINILEPILRFTPNVAELFAPKGTLLKTGDLFRNPDLGRLLQRIGAGDIDTMGDDLLLAFGSPVGRLTQNDLNARQVRRHAPLSVFLGDNDILLNPPPSSGGLLIAFCLRLIEGVPPKVWEDEYQTLMHLIAAMAISNEARATDMDAALNRQATSDVAGDDLTKRFLADDYVDSWREAFGRAAIDGPRGEGIPELHLGSTTHMSVIDGEGMACAITSSNGEGCGHIIPDTGVMANNFLGEEDLHPCGFHQGTPGTRLTSMMCPAIVLRHGKPIVALGTGGSNRIRSVLFQVLVHHLIRGFSIEDAVMMPRVHYEGRTLFMEQRGIEHRLRASLITSLQARMPETVVFEEPNPYFGGVHAVAVGGRGAGDPRRGGAVRRST